MATTDISFRTFFNDIRIVVESAGLKLSPSMFSIQSTPKTIIDLAFCLDIQTQDSEKYRCGVNDMMRVSHAVTIRFSKKLKPLDQFSSQLEAVDSEELIIGKMMSRTNLPNARVLWKSTKRAITTSREYLIVEMLFDIEHDWSFISLE